MLEVTEYENFFPRFSNGHCSLDSQFFQKFLKVFHLWSIGYLSTKFRGNLPHTHFLIWANFLYHDPAQTSMESETIYRKLEIKQSITEIAKHIASIEQELYEQRRFRPHNLPYILHLEQQVKTLRINQQHCTDRLDKLDGCF